MKRIRRRHVGVGARIKQRLLALGYVQNGTTDEPDVMQFWRDKRPAFPTSYLYDWIRDVKVPGAENQEWLAAALEVDAAWLLFGPASAAVKRKRG